VEDSVPDQPDREDMAESSASTVSDTAAVSGEPSPKPLAAVLVQPVDDGALAVFAKRTRLAEDRLAEVLSAYRQLKTDTESYRERATRSVERRFENRHERLLVKFIDILDSFDRALEAAEKTYAGAPLIEGLILVRTQLLQTLQQEGLERIPVLGLPFDPHVSEAMSTESTEDPERAGMVVKEYLRGYRFNGKLVRPSRVVVAQYVPATTATTTGPEETSLVSVEIAADDHPEPPHPTPLDDEAGLAAADAADEGPSLEEIVARAEAQQALFHEAFSEAKPAAAPALEAARGEDDEP
jgi:molecular chaperone GrpE